MNCSAFFLRLLDDLFVAFDFRLSPCWQVFQSPLFADCGVSVRNHHCTENGNRFGHKIVTMSLLTGCDLHDLCVESLECSS